MAVNVKMGVDIGGFTSGIKQGQQILKGLNAEMKASEAEFKATGDAEKKLNTQTKTLNSQLNVQKGIADQARQALKKMTDQGVDPADAAYQKLYVQLMNAEAGANEAQAALNALGGGAEKAADGADQLSNSLNSISKKVSLDQVINGIGKITSGLENAAKKAVDLGKQIWENITDAARWGDDTATQAMILNMDVEDYQKYKKVFDTVGELTVAEWQKAKLKVQKAINDPTSEQLNILSALGISTKQWGTVSGQSGSSLVPVGWEETFWKIGQTLRAKVAEGLMTQDQADVYANALFGRGFAELNPIFELGMEGFSKALEDQNVVTEESVNKLASLNDQLIKLQGDFDTLKSEVLAGLAPALEGAAKALDGMLTSLIEYLQKPEGQKMLEDLGTAVSGLFDDLKKIDPEDVVKGFTDVFNTVVGSIQWLSNNWEGVVTAIEGVFGFWTTLKVSNGVLTVLKVINGLKDLAGIGGGASASGVMSALGQALTDVSARAAEYIGNGTLQNSIPFVGDWFMNETSVGRAIGGKHADTWESVSKEFEQWQRDVFGEDGLIANFWNDWANLGNPEQGGEGKTVEVLPELPDNAEEILQTELGTMNPKLGVELYIKNMQNNGVPLADGTTLVPGHANGLSYVPYDGYLARLHKGERVMTAREVFSRSYNSNLYVESMYMNGGTDAAGLAAAMAAAQRRQISGYGS